MGRRGLHGEPEEGTTTEGAKSVSIIKKNKPYYIGSTIKRGNNRVNNIAYGINFRYWGFVRKLHGIGELNVSESKIRKYPL